MRRPFLSGAVVLVAVGLVVANSRVFSPRRETATRQAILASLPASLKGGDVPDPAGEARYARLMEIVRNLSDRKTSIALGTAEDVRWEELLAVEIDRERAPWMLQALLDEGPIRFPVHPTGWNFTDAARLKDLSKLLAASASSAALRGDTAECARLVDLNLRYGQALLAGRGLLIEKLVAVAIESVADRSAYEAEMMGGLDAKGRADTLALLPPLDGPMPELGDAVRRDFQTGVLPFLLSPDHYAGLQFGVLGGGMPEGTFDALATARLIGRIDDAAIADTHRAFGDQTHLADRLVAQASENLPSGVPADEPGGLNRAWTRLYYRFIMDSGPNTLGRQLAAQSASTEVGSIGPHRAASRNLVRAVLLLRSGKEAKLTDPYAGGTLRVDAKRKIVWSVGSNGKDDGGAIGKGLNTDASDQGYAYGAWKPQASGGRSSGITGGPSRGPTD